MKDNSASPIKSFPVPEILKKHGIEKIMLNGTLCNMTRNDGQNEISFDMGKIAEQTLKNFSKAARALKLDSNLQGAIKLHFISEYHKKQLEEANKKSRITLRKLREDEDIFVKEGEGEKKERARRAGLEYEEVTIPQCVRMHQGAVKIVGGMISGSAEIEKMTSGILIECENCHSRYEVMEITRPKFSDEVSFIENRIPRKCPECAEKNWFDFPDRKLVNVARTELQEIESVHGVETLHTILLGSCTDGIKAAAGQPVVLYGEIFTLHVKKREITFVFVYNIEYLQRQEILELSNNDIQEFEQFAAKPDLIDQLVKKFSISVFGHEEIKKGILLSAINTSEDSATLKRRINTALIGETGLAKSRMLRNSCELVPKSKFCSAPTSSVRSWICIIDKDSGLGLMPRYGNIVLASGGICAIDEIGRLPYEDQGLLLNAYQEGMIPFAKHGITLNLPGSATFIVSSNPKNPEGLWRQSDTNTIELSEIPLLGPLRDRTDLIFIMRGNKDEEYLEDFAIKKIQQVNDSDNVRKLEEQNHIWLRKYIFFCKDFRPTISDEAAAMLARYYRDNGKKSSPRMVETLFNIAYAITRLKQKNVIGVEEATETMEFYNNQISYWSEIAEIPADPRAYVENEVVKKLEGKEYAYEFTELVRQVCNDSKIAAAYIGTDFRVDSNKKLRAIRDMFTNSRHENVIVVEMTPLLLAWEPTYNNWNIPK